MTRINKIMTTTSATRTTPSHSQSHDGERADLEARGTASPVPMAAPEGRVQQLGSQHEVQRSSHVRHSKEEIEKALEGLDRDDLVVALGRAKVQMDEIEARLDEQLLRNELFTTLPPL